MKQVLQDGEIITVLNNTPFNGNQSPILKYVYEDVGYCRLVFTYGSLKYVFLGDQFLTASQDDEPDSPISLDGIVFDMAIPLSPMEKQAYNILKDGNKLLWQALGKEEPKETIIKDNTPLYSDDLTIEDYNKTTSSRDCWKPTEFEDWQVKQKQAPFMDIHDGFNLMDVVYWCNDYGVEFTSRIVGFADDGLHLAPLDVGSESYWTVKNINRFKIRKATLRDIFRTNIYNIFNEFQVNDINTFYGYAKEHDFDFKEVFSTAFTALMRSGDRFLSYCEGEVKGYNVPWYNANTYQKACIQFEKEYN